MARELVGFFKRWCSSIKVDSYEKLSDLIVLEQFKYILPERLATFMCEHKVETAAQAAILADEYVLTRVGYRLGFIRYRCLLCTFQTVPVLKRFSNRYLKGNFTHFT